MTSEHQDGNEKKIEEQRTFVKKATGTYPAAKYDFDLIVL